MADRYGERALEIVDRFMCDDEAGADMLYEAIASALREQDAWWPIDDPEHPAPRDGTRFLAVVDGLVRIVSWGKTSHVPFNGFCLADQGPEEYDLCQPTHYRPLPAPPLSGRKTHATPPDGDGG